MAVQISCQNCRSAIREDSSLEDLSTAAYNLLVGSSDGSKGRTPRQSLPSKSIASRERRAFYDDATRSAANPPQRPDGSNKDARPGPAMSFVMLTESQIAEPSNAPFKQAPSSSQTPSSSSPPQAIPYNTERLNRIYEILSSRSDIDHPICVECTELVLSGLQTRLDNAVRERDSYVSFLKQVNSNVPTAKQLATAQTELQTAQAAEKKAFASLCSVEEEKEAIETEIAALEAEAEQLDEEERAFWRQHNAFSEKLSDFQNARDAVNIRYDRDTALLARLQRTNVITDAFAIGYDGKYATINGLRLGRSTVQPVEWAEINAAYGYTVLLLCVLAEKVGFQFQGFRLHPLGSTSKIEELPAAGPNGTKPPPIMHELFTTSDVLPLGLELFSRSFDAAQAAFLTCVGQLLAHVQADPAMAELAAKRQRLKYGIRKDRIGSEEPGVGMLSIRLGIGSGRNEEWTRACKFLLTVCKYLLAVVGLREESQPGQWVFVDSRETSARSNVSR